MAQGSAVRGSMSGFRVACIQVNAGDDWRRNLSRVLGLSAQAVRSGSSWIALPETFCWRGSRRDLESVAKQASPETVRVFRDFSRRHRVSVLLGSVLEPTETKGKYFNTSLVLDPAGRIVARYRKIHLFDIAVGPGLRTRESRSIRPGRRVVTFAMGESRAGLSICYDLRFPELFRKMSRRGARIFFVPSNFTYETGKAHWEILLRARAVENQAYVIAPGQSGRNPDNGILSYGNSMIVDPWGRILGRAGVRGEGVISAILDLGICRRLDRTFPVLRHRRLA